jgi:dolichol kinase
VELERKSLHLLFVAVPVLYALGAPRGILLQVLGALLLIALLVEWSRARYKAVRYRFEWLAGRLLRPAERAAVSGATWLLLAFTAVLWLFPRDVAVAAMWAVSAGDAAAAIVGRSIGRFRIRNSRKTLEGSLACLVVVTLGLAVLSGAALPAAIVLGVVAAGAEWPHGPPDDNVRVAGAVALAALILYRIS